MSADASPKPYKGPESYQAEDAHLFFGRDAEADQLIAKIVSARFTLVHAQSGAGKTSLLNARIVPGLQSRYWLAVRVLPQNDPVESIRVTTLQCLFPPLAVEREAIQAARDALLEPGEDVAIETLLARYDSLDVRRPESRALVRRRPASSAVTSSVFPASGDFDPVFCRLLRGNIHVAQFREHLAAMRGLSPGDSSASLDLSEATPIGELLRSVAEIEAAVDYEKIVNQLYAPVPDLCAFFENISGSYGSLCGRFKIVLVLDQFEELFTRFVDVGSIPTDLSTPPLDWRLRWELFDELKRLYTGPSGSPLPIHFVVSMRDEYLAQLDPLRAFVPDLDANAYHLGLLSTEAAREAIRKPALQFGYDYSDECFSQLVSQLTKEDRFIEPTHLQIVCEKLWVRRGRELADLPADADAKPPIEAGVLMDLNGAAGILRSFFREFLDELQPEMRMEVLEMLEQLVTSSGSRNIVELGDLTRPKYRRAPMREHLLRLLEQRSIVRLESRLGGKFAEIVHEFLIGPILQSLREELQVNPDYGRARLAPRILSMFDGIDFRVSTGRLLGEYEFRSLHQFRSDIRWDDWSVELMLRSAIVLGISESELQYWIQQYEDYNLDIDRLLSEAERTMRLLAPEEVRALSGYEGTLSQSLAAKVLRSVLTFSAEENRDEVAQWARRLVEDEST
jgi:hypothetical protein